MKWEYLEIKRTVEWKDGRVSYPWDGAYDDLTEMLNVLGDDEWECVALREVPGSLYQGWGHAVFKRPYDPRPTIVHNYHTTITPEPNPPDGLKVIC